MKQDFDLVIEPGRAAGRYWRDLWDYRGLFFFLAWRDILVRYKQTVIGVAWGVIRPLITMAIFTLIFGRIAGLSAGNTPYPIMVFAALLPWQFFASAVSESSMSLVGNSNLLTKVFFPRLVIPASAVVVNLVDFAICCVLLFVMMLGYGLIPSPRIFLAPVFLLQGVITALGFGLWFSALNVKYRDFRYVVPFVVQLGLYISPVGFRSEVVPQTWRLFYSLNPMVGVIDGFRWAVLGEAMPLYLPGYVLSLFLTLAMFFTGFVFFRKVEEVFADIV